MNRPYRKLEHIKYSIEQNHGNKLRGFNNVQFVHNALPEISYDETSVDASLGQISLKSPIIINAMTGGAEEVKKINMELAMIAKETGIAMAVGSQMAGIDNKEYISTYSIVRKINPKGIIIANIGSEANVEHAREAIEMIEADFLQIHLNPVQELTMQEGDRNFTGVLDRIQAIKEKISTPIIVKEVGFGISKEVASKLNDRGISIIDVGGKGGTNFADIENRRRSVPISIFTNWGIETVTSILEVKTIKDLEVIAAGGIINSQNVLKAIGLGASSVGMAGIILKKLMDTNVLGVIEFIEQIHYELRLAMTCLGVRNLLELHKVPMVLTGETREWCELRGIHVTDLARRQN